MPQFTPSNPSGNSFLNRPLLILICFFGLITAIKILLSGLIQSPQIFEDELVYDILARQVYNGALLTTHLPYPPWPFSPGYSFIISIAYLFTPDKYVAYHYMLIINAVLTSTILFPAYYLLKPVVSRGLALSSAIIIALLPAVTINTYVLMSEALFIPLTLFSVFFVQRSLSTDQPGMWDILTGLSVFLLYFTRATGISMVIGLIIAVIWVLKTRGFVLDQLLIKKIIFLAGPGLLLYLAWITDQLLLKGGLPSGYSAGYYLDLVTAVLTRDPGHLIYVFLEHLDYLLLGSFIIFPLFTLIAGYSWLQSVIREQSTELRARTNQDSTISKNIPVTLYCSVLSVILFLFTVAHMCNLSYEYSICGRYVDAIIPLIIISGTIGLHQAVVKGNFADFLKPGCIYLVLVSALSTLVMLPIAHQPNNNPGIFVFYTLTAEYILPTLVLLLGIVLIALTTIIIRLKKGALILMILLIILAAFCSLSLSVWDIKTTKDYGALLPFCQSINMISADSTEIFWDSSSEKDSWDKMVYFTLKFWLGDRVTELDQKSQAKGKALLITKGQKGDALLAFRDYRVVPFQS